jgi:hypothetical protein
MIRFAVTFRHVLIALPMEEGIVAVASPVAAEEAVAAVAGKALAFIGYLHIIPHSRHL